MTGNTDGAFYFRFWILSVNTQTQSFEFRNHGYRSKLCGMQRRIEIRKVINNRKRNVSIRTYLHIIPCPSRV